MMTNPTHSFKHPNNDLNWQMPWQEFDVTLGRRKILHLNNLNISSHQEAMEFLGGCGFNLQDESHVRVLEQFYCEAIFFIRHVLFSSEERKSIKVPNSFLNIINFNNLLLIASDTTPKNRYERAWACAILKVVNAIANIEYSSRVHELDHARSIIFEKIKNIIRHDGDSWSAHYKNFEMHLAHVDWKEAKTRNSFILKLLNKPDFIADDIFDHLGVRFVVFNHSDAPQLLRLLIEAKIILPQYVVTGRSRNNMILLDTPRKLLEVCHDLYSNGTITNDEYSKMCQRVSWQHETGLSTTSREANTHSSSEYRSLQITVRHLIRIPNPAHHILQTLSRDYKALSEMEKYNSWVNNFIPEEIVHFFPLEIQILDYRGYEQSKFGKASHDRYKASQLAMVRASVIGHIMDANKLLSPQC